MADDGSSTRTSRWPLVLAGVVALYAVGLFVLGGEEALQALTAAAPQWLLAALGLQVIVVLLWPMVHRASLQAVGHTLPFRQVLPVSMTIFSVSRTAPVGGAVGAAVGVERFGRRGVPGPVATAAAFLTGPFDLLTIVLLGVMGVVAAVVAGELTSGYLAVAGVALTIVVLVLAGIVWALHSPAVGHRVIGWVGKVHRTLEDRTDGWRSSWTDVSDNAPRTPGVLRIMGWSLAKWSVSMASLGLVFLAFGETPDLTVLLVGFGISHLASTIPTTPGAVGVAEGGMVGAFAALGIPVGVGTTVAIAYRVLETWLPTVAGIPVLVRGSRERDEDA